MEVKLSPLMRKALADPIARKQISLAMTAAENNEPPVPIEIDGKKYTLTFGRHHQSDGRVY